MSSNGRQGNEDSYAPVISANGRYVAFASGASNLVARDGNGQADVFVRDLGSGKTERVSVGSNGQEAEFPPGTLTYDQGSLSPSISADGSIVAFSSTAANLVAGDTNNLADVFVRDLSAGETTRVSVSTDGEQTERIKIQEVPYGGSSSVSISGDGTVVMFATMAPNLVEGDTNKLGDTFVHDLKTQETERVSVSSSGRQATGAPMTNACPRKVAAEALFRSTGAWWPSLLGAVWRPGIGTILTGRTTTYSSTIEQHMQPSSRRTDMTELRRFPPTSTGRACRRTVGGSSMDRTTGRSSRARAGSRLSAGSFFRSCHPPCSTERR